MVRKPSQASQKLLVRTGRPSGAKAGQASQSTAFATPCEAVESEACSAAQEHCELRPQYRPHYQTRCVPNATRMRRSPSLCKDKNLDLSQGQERDQDERYERSHAPGNIHLVRASITSSALRRFAGGHQRQPGQPPAQRGRPH